MGFYKLFKLSPVLSKFMQKEYSTYPEITKAM